jgi:hypothetical protein
MLGQALRDDQRRRAELPSRGTPPLPSGAESTRTTDDRAHEAEQSEPRRERKVLGYDSDRRVLRQANDQARVDHTP